MLASVQPAPPDPILGLTEAYRADDRPGKINLGVGIYRDAQGRTPVLDAVRQAERVIADTQASKDYLPIDGEPGYHRAVRELLLGHDLDQRLADRVRVCSTPGGTGGLRVLAEVVHFAFPDATLWVPTPTWPNHPAIFAAANLPTQTYRYFDPKRNSLRFDEMIDDLGRVPDGHVVLLHGCCHNPTGVDPTPQQWQAIADLLAGKAVLPLIDLAYQGFGDGLDADAVGARTIIDTCPESLVVSSFSKNFSLYRERVGAITIVGEHPPDTAGVLSRVKQIVRRNYSNPPGHGAEIVRTILNTPALRERWLGELDAMRSRINDTRSGLAAGLDARGVSLAPDGNGFIGRQRGMFTLTGMTGDQVVRMRDQHAVYAVGSGRINVAGITPDKLDAVCDAIADALQIA
jgi:aspartate/tyrosine/aromatic aminotransferase